MARDFLSNTLILVFADGVNKYGDVKYARKSFKNIAQGLTDETLCTIGDALSKMYPLILSSICLDEDSVLETR